MAFIDYYKILGVDKDIPQKDVKRAYLKRAKQFHPDLHPDDPKAKAKFQALTEAYDVIGDPDKRSKYDRYGEQWRNADAFGGAGNGAYGYSEVLRSRVSIFPVSEVPVAGSVRFSNNSSAGQAADVHVAATGQVSAVRVEIPAT